MPSHASPPPKHPRINYRQHDYKPHRPSPLRLLRRPYVYLPAILLLLYLYHPSLPFTTPHLPTHTPSLNHKNIDWTRYAYSQYATNSAYLCNALMVFSTLHSLSSKPHRLLFYPQEWDLDISSTKDRDSQLLVKARDEYNVKLMPVEVPQAGNDAWNSSFVKFFAWGETQYHRVLHLDSDITMLKHLDELFLLPRAPVAMLRAYWELPTTRKLTSLFVLLEPSAQELERLLAAADPKNRKESDYDMEILNRFYGDSAMILPHRQYGLLSGEFRTNDHSNFLGNTWESWNPDRALAEASLVHFSDWPLPKPWIMWPRNLIGEVVPRCEGDGLAEVGKKGGCRNREVWMGLYDGFRKRRKEVCKLLSVPAPEWPPRNVTGLGKAEEKAGVLVGDGG